MVLKAAFGLAFSVLGLFPGGGISKLQEMFYESWNWGLLRKPCYNFAAGLVMGRYFRLSLVLTLEPVLW